MHSLLLDDQDRRLMLEGLELLREQLDGRSPSTDPAECAAHASDWAAVLSLIERIND